MNIGQGADFRDSGELWVLQRLAQAWEGQKGLVLFDVGANRGDYALALATVFSRYEEARLFVFEPSPRLYQELAGHLPSVVGELRLAPQPIGLGREPVTAVLHGSMKPERAGHNSLYKRRLDHFGAVLDQDETVSIQTLDGFCAANGIRRIHFLKLDIEGHELAALQGAGGMLATDAIDVIQFEFGGCNIDSRAFWQDFFYLLKDRYRLYRILRRGLWEIPGYRETDEIFVTTNFLAIRRGLHADFLRD